MKRCSAVVITVLLAVLAVVDSAEAQDKTAVVTTAAPIYLLPDASRAPLRILEVRALLHIRYEQGEWLQVEFQDRQFGLRTGYIQARHVQLTRAERDERSDFTSTGVSERPAPPRPLPPTPSAETDVSRNPPPVKATPTPSSHGSEIAGADNPEKTVYVREYTRKDGTKVKAHMRRPPGAGSDREKKKRKK